MTDYTTLKVHPEAAERLEIHKRKGETWSGVLHRAVDALDAGQVVVEKDKANALQND